MATVDKVDNINAGLAKLREPFDQKLISKLPKPTKSQTESVRADYKTGIRCQQCGTWHHKDVVHLDYVGHAALTDRLLDADPEWNWEPVKTNDDGTPALDRDGGMWIRLTVCGVTRLGYGDAQDKVGANATKERIGDALRNAGMRFGAALDLWSKADLHYDEHDDARDMGAVETGNVVTQAKTLPPCPETSIDRWIKNVESGKAQADALMAFAKAKYSLTKAQEERIAACVTAVAKQNQPIDAEFTEDNDGETK